MEKKETEYIVDTESGSVYRREITSKLTEVFATRKSFEESLEVFMTLLKDDYTSIFVQAKLTGRTVYYVHYCPTLKYLAEFKLTGNKKIIPVEPGRGDYQNTEPLLLRNWTDENNAQYRLFFIHKEVYAPSGERGERKAYLILIRKTDGKLFLPPIANVYEDGRICFGGDSSRPRYDRGNFPCIDDYITFTNARANFDLAPRGYDEFASFDVEGNQLGKINSGYLRVVSPLIDVKVWEEIKKWQ